MAQKLLKLMIVDDSNIIRSKITRTLSQHHMEVVATASNGEEAISLFTRTTPDVVTMDPDHAAHGRTGVHPRALRKLNSRVHILVVSALADKATAIQALKEGAQGFLCKPFFGIRPHRGDGRTLGR